MLNNYICRAADSSGKVKEILREAKGEAELKAQLKEEGLFLLSFKKTSKKNEGPGRKFKQKSVMDFTETLSLMINSKLTLRDSIKVAGTVFQKGENHRLIESVSRNIALGKNFTESLRALGSSFSPVYLGLIEVGERTGTIDTVLSKLSAYLSSSKKMKDNMVGAMAYPLFVMAMAIILSIAFVFFGLPMFNEIFSTFGEDVTQELDRSTQIVNIVVTSFLSVSLSVLAAVIISSIVKKRDFQKGVIIDRFILKLPLIGAILTQQQCLNLMFALDTLSGCSVPLEEGLVYGEKVLTNYALKDEVMRIRDKIIKGENLSDAFLESDLFPERIGSWIQIGEKAGDITSVFSQLSLYFERETEKKVTIFMGMIDPALTVGAGLVILSLILLFILPVLTAVGGI